jgi:DNA-binding response OmpR family regulator
MPKILIVDDDEGLRRRYRQELESEGYEVETVASAAEALDRAGSLAVDGVVLDLHLNGADGLSVLRKMVKGSPRVAVVVNSAYSHFKTNFATWSADEYVVKSSDLSELKKALRSAIGRRGSMTQSLPAHRARAA